MKKPYKLIANILPLFLMAMLLVQGAFAQDKGLDIEIDLSPEPVWYEQTWLLVAAGAAVFILILVAILKNNGKKVG
ncbi:MAG: hypothetical protein PSV36_16550 [Algoriphagus sp.]|nr:hypothetical protein [Algoriphagus sp.]